MPSARKKHEAAAVIEYRSDNGPKGTMRVDDPATVKVLLDPKRQQVLRRFVEPHSIREVAEMLGEVPSKLHYHVRLLEKQGVVRVVAERKVGSNIERVYQLAARRFEVAAELGSVTRAAGGATSSIIASAARYGAAIDHEDELEQRVVKVVRETARTMTHAQAQRFWKRMAMYLDELEKETPEPKRDGVVYGLHVMMAPLPQEDDRR